MATTNLTSKAADARVTVTNSNWSTARNATTGTLQAASTNPTATGDDFTSPNYNIRRFFMEFDASSISSSDIVNSAEFSFQVSAVGGAGQTLHLVASSQANPVVADDYNNLTFTSLGSVSCTTTGIKTITLNSSGLSHLQSNVGGDIKVALIGNGDQSNTPPASANIFITFYTGDEPTNQKPTLSITHTPSPAADASPMFFSGGGLTLA